MFVEGGGGWSKKKRKIFEAGFREFLNYVTINSKDTGPTILGKHLFNAQERFIKAVFDALEEDIHDIYVLKSRQRGASTLTRAFSVFWLGMHEGLTGALVFDTDKNMKSARREIENLIRSLPKSLRFPSIASTNREGLTLDNQSTILFMSAGIKVSKGSGTLGRSIGLSYGHQSEMCSWANPEGIIAYRQSLSKIHPNRLYIWESTARGYNDWWRMWVEAKADDGQKRCLFLGWWSKPSQMIRRSHPDFKKFGLQPPTPIEQEKILQVKEWYDYQITPEQLAWIRKDSDPLASAEDGESMVEYEADSYHLSEQPWTEEDAFQQSGSIFFPPESLKKLTDEYVKNPEKTYSFATFAEFIDTRIHPAANARQVQLKVWDEPEVGDAFYVVSADPAYGSSERSDRSVIEVLRCYADGCDQVAEYTWPLVGTRQFAWAILAVAGHYAANTNEVRLIIELNGPGRSVWDEIIAVRRHIASGYQPKEIDDLGIRRVFANVKNYIYTRNDSLEAGKAWQWTTASGPGPSSKIRVMERFRDAVSTDKVRIRSLDLIEEMKSIERNEDDGIAAGGSGKDDRVIAMALAIHCWDDRVVPIMSARKRTREFEYSRRRLTIADMSSLYMKAQFDDMLKRKQVQRKDHLRALRMAQRGYR